RVGRSNIPMKRTIVLATVLLLLFAPLAAPADVKLPAVFGDHMVLQRGQKIPVWGWADAGEKVTVTISAQSQEAVADERGKWRVTLLPIESSSPLEMRIEGKNSR